MIERDGLRVFEPGRVYDGRVCIARWRDEWKGELVAFIDAETLDEELKFARETEEDFDARVEGREYADIYHVRIRHSVEYAIDESELPEVDGSAYPDEPEMRLKPEDVAEVSAKSPGRKMALAVQHRQNARANGSGSKAARHSIARRVWTCVKLVALVYVAWKVYVVFTC